MILKGHCSHTNIFRTWANPKIISLQARRSSILCCYFYMQRGVSVSETNLALVGKEIVIRLRAQGTSSYFYTGLGIHSLVFQANHLLFENERGKVLFAIFKVWIALVALTEANLFFFSDSLFCFEHTRGKSMVKKTNLKWITLKKSELFLSLFSWRQHSLMLPFL